MRQNNGTTAAASRPLRALGGALAVAAVALPASAEEWTGSATVYGWLPAIDGKVTAKDSGDTAETTISGGDILEALKFAAMAAGDLHYGRFGVLTDFFYSNLGSGGELDGPGPFESDVSVGTKMTLWTAALGYQAYVEDGALIEPFAGFRYVSMDTEVRVFGGGPAGVEASASSNIDWWDPVIGVRGRAPLTETLSVGGFFDIGGFGVGSEFTWDLYVGLDYAVSENLSAVAGFRYLSIDYDSGAADVEIDTYGPLLGMTYRF